MKIKLDENLPLRLATRLTDASHDLQTVHDERLVGHSDIEMWQSTQKESRFLITQDLDFFRPAKSLFLARTVEFCCSVFTRRIARAWLVELSGFFKEKALASGLAVLLSRRNARFAC
jgi:Domain of unknown function (DUF5615)